jgi:RecA/RadA recombinase
MAREQSSDRASSLDACLARVKESAKKAKKPLSTIVDVANTWTYIDFVDTMTGTPCLPLEWIYGCRGMMPGRVEKYDGFESRGKSALLYLKFAMAQRRGAFTVLLETERASPTPTFIGSCGADPEKVIIMQPATASECVENLKSVVVALRKEDPKGVYPIVVGIDSISGLADAEMDPVTGEAGDGGGIGATAREFSAFFRNHLPFLEDNKVFLIGVGQYRSKISTVKTFGYVSPQDQLASLADKPWKFHASWRLDMSISSNAEQNAKGLDVITLSMLKSKMGRTKGHKTALISQPGAGGWDFTPANIQLLFKGNSPFEPGTYTDSGNGYYTHVELEGGKKLRAPEFVAAFYANADLLNRCRNALRVYGFGLPFEKDYGSAGPFSCADDDEQEQEAGDAG